MDLFSIPKKLVSLMAIVFGLFLIRHLFTYLREIYTKWMTESIYSDVRSMGFGWFARADNAFFDQHGLGELINVITIDGIRAGDGFLTFFSLASASLLFMCYFALLLALFPLVTVLTLAIVGVLGLVMKSRIAKSRNIGLRVSAHNQRISSAIVERLGGIRLLKLSGTEEKESALIKEISESIKRDTYNLFRIRARMELMIDPMSVLAGLVILYVSLEVLHMTLAETGIFIFVLLRLMPHVKEIFKIRQRHVSLMGSVSRVKTLFEEAKSSATITGGSVQNVSLRRGIRFENVSFGYNTEDGLVLKDVNLFIPAGKMTALVGRSGAGKSTLVDLIPRLRVPVQGRITFDEIPVESFDLTALRRSIAFVSQEGFLFNDTIENNVRYSRLDASSEEVYRVCRMAYADPFIREFSSGYQTIVGERGVKLSGGQRQRIILARAMLQAASIIILDEPTSALDSESEQYIQRAMERIRAENRVTLVVIAHRLSTIRSADQIIVLDKGRVVESGSHTELTHDDAWYADMVKKQALG
jgi:ABC-type multidrug transport system fused ATPase/permease subunit